MLDDVTVDTNVFLHSVNEAEERCAASKEFLEDLLRGDTFICIDEGFDMDESKNKSAIGCEYHSNLRYVNTAFAVLVALGRKGQIKQVNRAAVPAANRRILQMVRNKVDRVFLRVCLNSGSRVFVSHDFVDFQVEKRDRIRRELRVQVVEASELV